MGTFVTLAEVLESRGSSLEEDEVWALLLGSAEALIEISDKDPGNMCHVITPCSILLSTSGNIAFKTCSRFEDVASFTSPEISHSNACSRRQGTEKMVVYSLGMTLYWAVDYQLPQTQPVQLSDHLNRLLLSMCEDVPHKRVNLLTVLKTCEQRHKNSLLCRPEKVIKQMAQDILQTGKLSNYGACLTDRSQMVRERLRGASCQNSDWPLKGNSTPTQSNFGRSCHSSNQRSHNSTWVTQSPNLDIRRPLSRLNQLFGSAFSLNEKKIMDVGPEFIRMLEEPLVILELPNSIVSNKGRLIANQRELRVLMPNGRNILVKCDIKSRAGDIFDMIIAYLNIMEHFYFGLAYNDDGEFFFVNKETNISEVAPDSWKKVPTATFALYFRISYFVNNVSLLLHKLTRHQYYLQLRRDLLEDKLTCNEETCLFLGALALQAEWGDSIPEVHGKNFYQPEHYVSKSILQKMSLPFLKEELLRLHANNVNMVAEESELEFLKTIQQLPDYGVLFHRVAREKKPVFGDLVLGVCAKGVIVYDVINNSRTTSLRFHWREIISITSARRKFIIESSTSKKKHTFLTEKSKVAKYLCNLCSTQHKFHKEMGSRQLNHTLASEESIVQYAAMCRAKNNMIRSMSEVHDGRLNASSDDSMSKLCEDIAIRIEAKIKQQRDFLDQTGINSPGLQSDHFSSQKRCSEFPSIGSPLQDTPTSSRPPEREIVCASLNKDPRIGLGIVIVGEDSAERLDLGIFIASIVPGGPADRDGRIKPGGRMISLNQISLEGVSFSEAIDIMQNSSNEVELIVSQPKVGLEKKSHLAERNYESQSTIPADSRAGDDYLDELISVMMTPKSMNRLHVPEVRIINAQDDYSRSVSLTSLRPEEFSLKLRKSDGSLGISIAGGVNTGLRHGGIYIKSLVSGGVAEQDGRIQTGDRLLEVDGTRLQGFTDQQAAECLARTREVVSLVLERDGGSERPVRPMSPKLEHTLTVNIPASATLQMRNSCPAITMTTPFTIKPRDYSFVSDDNILEVTLRKRLNGLGFSFFITELDTSLDCGTIVCIKTLFPGQPAEKSGQIQQGDAILSINGESLKGLSSQQVLQLLRNSPLDVQLVLCRPAEGILPPITGNVGQLTCS